MPLMVKAIGGLFLTPSDTGAMPQKIHPYSRIERKRNPEAPGVSRLTDAFFERRALEKSLH
jgi:hypothetical protein